MKIKTFFTDAFINIAATALPIAILNLIVYPFLASNISVQDYGTLITSISLVHFVNGIFGSSVSYLRLLNKDNCLNLPNYTYIVFISVLLGTIFNILLLFMTSCILENVNVILLSLCVCLVIINNYLVVEYRIQITYIRVLLSNFFICLGYIIGCIFFIYDDCSSWEWIFVLGFGFSVIYNVFSTHILKAELVYDNQFRNLISEYGVLVLTTSISGCSTYLDKLIVYPMLGATAIAYYQTASIISKVLPMIAGAISNVLLSYLVKIDSISKNFFLKLICLGAIVSSFGFVICNKIVIIFIKIFYPTFLDSCIDIIPYANVIAILQMSYIFIYPYSMRFNKRKRLYVIELCELIPYCILSLILIDLYGIVGFCIATIFAISFKMIVAVLLILKNIE